MSLRLFFESQLITMRKVAWALACSKSQVHGWRFGRKVKSMFYNGKRMWYLFKSKPIYFHNSAIGTSSAIERIIYYNANFKLFNWYTLVHLMSCHRPKIEAPQTEATMACLFPFLTKTIHHVCTQQTAFFTLRESYQDFYWSLSHFSPLVRTISFYNTSVNVHWKVERTVTSSDEHETWIHKAYFGQIWW